MALFKMSGELRMWRWVEMVRDTGFEPLTYRVNVLWTFVSGIFPRGQLHMNPCRPMQTPNATTVNATVNRRGCVDSTSSCTGVLTLYRAGCFCTTIDFRVRIFVAGWRDKQDFNNLRLSDENA